MRDMQQQWVEWDGEGYTTLSSSEDSAVLYVPEQKLTLTEHETASLARTIQQLGLTDSLFESKELISSGKLVVGFSGFRVDDNVLVVCDSDGMTYYGDSVEAIIPTTWVEIDYGQ